MNNNNNIFFVFFSFGLSLSFYCFVVCDCAFAMNKSHTNGITAPAVETGNPNQNDHNNI